MSTILHGQLAKEETFEYINQARACGVKVHLITSGMTKCKDDFIRVQNFVPRTIMDQFPWDDMEDKLKNAHFDPKRTVRSVDYGYAGSRCSARSKEYEGLAHPCLLTGTEYAKEFFRAFTKILHQAFPDLMGKIYHDDERMPFFAHRITGDKLNIGEALCLAITR